MNGLDINYKNWSIFKKKEKRSGRDCFVITERGSRHTAQDSGKKEQETRSKKQETRSKKQETRIKRRHVYYIQTYRHKDIKTILEV